MQGTLNTTTNDNYSPDALSVTEESIRKNLIDCLLKLKEKNQDCIDKARLNGQERLEVELITVKSRIDGIIREIKIGMYPHQYRFDSMKNDELVRLREYDSNMKLLITECESFMILDPEADRCKAVMDRLRKIAKIFKARMSLLRTLRIYG